ncbi:E3 ubiquitin-protein ligase TRIM45-like [Porites lutea]|uniref:E3 ubiquitin-protein ligase TRIM45-like n=1 Tax=Porites lutea TaxID=51062 RepID=UPI003CC570EC
MESLLINLKEQVTCAICLDSFTDPKTITCLHTFCCDCLKKHALISQRNGKFRCPECQAEVDLPEANCFDKLPSSFHHNRLLSLLAARQSGDGNEISCGICKKKSAEISYCFECAKFMCSDCVNAHQLFTNLTEGHKVTPVKQFQPQDYEALMKRQSFCSQQYHEREIVRFFCLKCKLCVCQICIATDHKSHEGHDVELLDKVADGEKVKILERAKMLKETTKLYSDAIFKLEQTELELHTNITNVKHEVSQTAEQIIAKIRESEREIITFLENTRESRLEMLNSAKTQVQSLLKQINQAVEFAEQLVQKSSSSDIMQSKAKLRQRYNELESAPIPELPVNSFMKYFPNLELEKFSVGCVATSEPIIKGLNQDIQAGVESEFEVIPRIPKEKAEGVKVKFQCEVLIEPAEKVGSLRTYEKEEATLVKFVPKVPGTFNITVKINGKVLSTNTVQVKQRLIQVLGEFELKNETFEKPLGLAVNSKGQIAVVDNEKHCVLITDMEGNCLRKLSCYGNKEGQLKSPSDVTYLNDDNILVADELNRRIQQFNVQTGDFVKSFGKRGTRDGEFQNPVSVCVDDEGRVIVVDTRNHRVQVLSQDGEPLFKFGDSGPEKLGPFGCIYHENKFIVSDWDDNSVQFYDSTGKFLYKTREPRQGDERLYLKGPRGLCLQKCGNHHNLLVCDRDNGRVDQFTLEGCFTGKTDYKFKGLSRITTTPDGLILVSDFKADKIYILK